MKAVMDKLVSPAIIPRLPSMVSAMYDAVETDMSISELLSFMGTLQEAKDNGLKSEMLPGKPVYIDDISYWIPDISKTRQILASTLGVKMNSSITNSIEYDAQEYEESMPDNAVEIPDAQRIKQQLEQEREERREQIRREREERQERTERRSEEDYEQEYERGRQQRMQELQEIERGSVDNQTETPSRQTAEPVPPRAPQNVEVPDMNTHSEGKN